VQPSLNKMSKCAIQPYSVETLKIMMSFCPQQQLLFLQLFGLFMVNSLSGHCNFCLLETRIWQNLLLLWVFISWFYFCIWFCFMFHVLVVHNCRSDWTPVEEKECPNRTVTRETNQVYLPNRGRGDRNRLSRHCTH